MKYNKDYFENCFKDYTEKEGNVWRFNWRASQRNRMQTAKNKLNDLLSLSNIDTKIKICEIGCATADFTQMYFNNSNMLIRGIDLSNTAVKICKKKYEGQFNVSFDQGSILELKEKEADYDIVICMDVLHYLQESDLEKALDEIKRIKKIDGYALLMVPLSKEDDKGDTLKKEIQKKMKIISLEYIHNYFYQTHIEPMLLWLYNVMSNRKAFCVIAEKIVKPIISSELILSVCNKMGKLCRCRANSHIILIAK